MSRHAQHPRAPHEARNLLPFAERGRGQWQEISWGSLGACRVCDAVHLRPRLGSGSIDEEHGSMLSFLPELSLPRGCH